MFNWINLIQILIVAAVLLVFYRTFIRNTSSEKLVRGLLGLGVLWIGSFMMAWFGLDILGGFLHWTALFISVGLVVVFQPELRKFLALMGNFRNIFGVISARHARVIDETDKAVDAIAAAAEYMSAKRTGALIVFQDPIDDTIIDKKGTKIDALISRELLLTIFFNKTPLHDGAVIIENDRIVSAGAILPLSQNEMNWKHGTRHRAALGMSETSKSAVLVVSEETGDISIAEKGVLKKYDDPKKLKSRIEKILKN